MLRLAVTPFLVALAALLAVSCSGASTQEVERPTREAPTETPISTTGGTMAKQYSEFPDTIIDVSKKYTATIKTSMGDIVVELFPEQAPNTVNSFVFLAQDDYYDGIIFHRVIPQFMIQGGDPTGTGTGGPGYQFGDEIDPGLRFDRAGYLAMANRGGGTGTNGSQFFITTVPTPHLNGGHTIFGTVTEGQDVADTISQVSRDGRDKPLEDVTINTIDITTE